MGKIINGREIALKIKEDIKAMVEKGEKRPTIASILVGNDGGSIYYMNNQEKVANSLGIEFNKIILDESYGEENLIKEIEKLNNKDEINGIMLQLPLPKGYNEERIIETINPSKDIDCLTSYNAGKLYTGKKSFIPCTPNSVMHILKAENIDIEGKEVVIVGRSNIVGKPLGQLLLNANATVTMAHSRTVNLKEVCKRADILIVAIGKPLFITKDYVKDGAVVIDVGTSSLNGKITGDVVFDEVIDIASLITPVPGGVGALTTTLLMKNACDAEGNNED